MSDKANTSSAEDAFEERLTAINARLDAGSRRMKSMQNELAANTEITAEIRDLMVAARVGFKVLGGLGAAAKWLGIVAGACVSVYALFYSITHGGVAPK